MKIEEGSEWAFLSQFPFDRIFVGVWIIENHPGIDELMKIQGYSKFGYTKDITNEKEINVVYYNEQYLNWVSVHYLIFHN